MNRIAAIIASIATFAFVANASAFWWPANMEEDMLSVVNNRFVSEDTLADIFEAGYEGSNLSAYTADKAASAVLAHRAGIDGVHFTQDDNPIETLEELYGIKGVGTESIQGLEIFVTTSALGAPLGSAILDMVNDADVRTLDDGAGLSARASNNIVNTREGGIDGTIGSQDDEYVPFNFVFGGEDDCVDAVPYVGKSSIQDLFDYAMLTQ